ncbi:MAG: indolepyruvate ferredoxin oxidoreductase subunit alpha [Desulfocapsaceae bacterium]|nr:indolepyruvate ferredoxin oxidoreductase subunit alpha [Desulfocapsaceae bacterium]
MTEKTDNPLWMSGNEAIALAAYEAGVKVASGYPGTPSTEILENLSCYEGVYTEWAPNEKVGLEVAIGASFAGVRALATMKHVGLNVAADPLFTASYTGVRGGLVVLVADDPEMHSSQNEQDSRNYAFAAKLPMLEPSDPAEAKELLKQAFAISEEYDTPVLFRTTTRIAHVKGVLAKGEMLSSLVIPGIEKMPAKFVMLPGNARARRVVVEERMRRLRDMTENAPFNIVEEGDSRRGFITSSVSYLYVKEAFPEAKVLKLGMCWPLPEQMIRDFASSVEQLYVVEELDPFLELHIKAMGIICHGKDLIPNQGELNTAIVRKAIDPASVAELFAPVALPMRPPNMCAGCPHRGIFYNLSRMKLFVSGDIGCYTLGFLPPLSAMDSCVCMGASVGIAHGMAKALGDDAKGKVVSVIGDSTFIHSGLSGLINTVYNGSSSLLIILDNRITAMTGQQNNPASGCNIKGEAANAIDLEALCRAVGVKHVDVVNPHDINASRKVLDKALERDEASVVIARAPCVLLPEMKKAVHLPYRTQVASCTGCMACVRLGCPAISWNPVSPQKAKALGYKEKQKGFALINEVQCNGCGQCQALCKFDAIVRREA